MTFQSIIIYPVTNITIIQQLLCYHIIISFSKKNQLIIENETTSL